MSSCLCTYLCSSVCRVCIFRNQMSHPLSCLHFPLPLPYLHVCRHHHCLTGGPSLDPTGTLLPPFLLSSHHPCAVGDARHLVLLPPSAQPVIPPPCHTPNTPTPPPPLHSPPPLSPFLPLHTSGSSRLQSDPPVSTTEPLFEPDDLGRMFQSDQGRGPVGEPPPGYHPAPSTTPSFHSAFSVQVGLSLKLQCLNHITGTYSGTSL